MQRISKSRVFIVAAFTCVSVFAAEPGAVTTLTFSENSLSVGLDYDHAYDSGTWPGEHHSIAGGLAIGDLHNYGWVDIYAVTGYSDDEGINTNPNKLFISDGDGTYSERANLWGLSTMDRHSSGPLIADFNGDGFNDLIVGGVQGNNIKVYLNTGSSGFTDATAFGFSVFSVC